MRRGLAALTLAYATTIWLFPWSDERVNDTFVLRTDASVFLHGGLPYHDVFFEYPPLAAPVVALPGIGGTGEAAYSHGLMAMSFALAVCVLLLVRALARPTGGEERVAVFAVAVAPLLLGAAFRNHFDLAPVALTLAALLLVLRARPLAGLALLGAAAAVKGYPAVAAVPVLAWIAVRDRATALRGAVAFALPAAAAAAAMLAISPAGAGDAVRWHLDRPVQVESTPAALLNVTGASPRATDAYRSDGLEHPAAGWLAALVAAAGVLALALLAIGAARNAPDPRALVLAALGATAAYAAFGKVLSPQYLTWTVPLMALALAWRRYALGITLAMATALTLFEFPARYRDLVGHDPLAVGATALRDALLVVAVALCVRELVLRRAAPPAPR